MKIVFIGAVLSSKIILENLIKNSIVVSTIISLDKKTGTERHEDYEPLKKIANKYKISYYNGENNQKIKHIVEHTKPDLVLVMGWSRLLTKEIIILPKFGVIGLHPAPLPYGRGRHPIIWAIILGLSKTKACLFKIDEKIDSGLIIDEEEIKIDIGENSLSLMKKVALSTSKMLPKVIKKIEKRKKIAGKLQKKVQTWSWRKRIFSDGVINFNSSSITIDRIVRALNMPYKGAIVNHSLLGEGRVLDLELTKRKRKPHDFPGLVIGYKKNNPLVCSYDNILILKRTSYKKKIKIGTWFY